jgi:alpha-mannosidase
MRLNQPLTAFVAPAHDGPLGKSFSLISISTPQVAIRAVKLAEDGNGIIVRLQELSGKPAPGVQIRTAGDANAPIEEVDGQERPIAPLPGNSIDMTPYSLRAFSIQPWQIAAGKMSPPRSEPLTLPYNVDVITARPASASDAAERAAEAVRINLANAANYATATPTVPATAATPRFDAAGDSLPGEMLPATLKSEGIAFNFASPGANNAVACGGQTIQLPAGSFNRIYLLAASSDGQVAVTFQCGGQSFDRSIEDWSGYIGLSDNRIWKAADRPDWDHEWMSRYNGLAPGYVRPDPVAWYSSHRHGPDGADQIYKYCYLFKYRLDVPAGAATLTLPNDARVKILAATMANDDNDAVTPTNAPLPWEGIAFTNPKLPTTAP